MCLQAYHSSAYNHSKQPYKGSATDIPSPPGMDPPLGKPPTPPHFKMELQMSAGSVGGAKAPTSNDNASRGSDDRVPCCHVTGVGSTTSPRDTFRHTGNMPYSHVDGATRCNVSATSAPPLVPVRTCSKNITLANMQASSRQRGGSSSSDGSANSSSHAAKWVHGQCDPRSVSQDNLPRHHGAQERLLRTSNENICIVSRTAPQASQLFHSSDDLNRVPPSASAAAAQCKSLTIGPINCSQSGAVNRAAVPYTRSNTTPLLVTPAAASTGNHIHPRHPRCRSNYYYPPRTGADPRMQVTSNGGDYPCRDTEGTCWRGSDASTYGLAVSYPVPSENVSELPKSYSTDFDTSHSQHGGSANRYSMPPTNDRTQPINLVTERMKKFESMDSVDSNSSVGSATSGSGKYQSDAPKGPARRFGCDSVASRTAQYEHMMSDDEEYVQREQLSGSLTQLQQRPNRAAPATINIYFRSESPQHPILQLDRSPHRPRAASHSPRCATRSPRMNLQIQRPEMGHRFAARQPSYLTAIHSPKGECLSIVVTLWNRIG